MFEVDAAVSIRVDNVRSVSVPACVWIIDYMSLGTNISVTLLYFLPAFSSLFTAATADHVEKVVDWVPAHINQAGDLLRVFVKFCRRA
jgi:hypothetical protein